MRPREATVRRAGALLLLALAVWCHVAVKRPHLAVKPPEGAEEASIVAPPVVEGLATFYADDFEGGTMADGGRFEMNDATIAAANRWPLGTRLLVRRLPGGPWDANRSQDDGVQFELDGLMGFVVIGLPVMGLFVLCLYIWCYVRACRTRRREKRMVYVVDPAAFTTSYEMNARAQNE